MLWEKLRDWVKPKAIATAERMLHNAEARGEGLNTQQVAKLVILAQGWMLGLYGRPLYGQRVEAWRYGPMVRCVYRRYRHHGGNPIEGPHHTHDDRFDEWERNLIDQVSERYAGWTGVQLSSITNKEGTPWAQTHAEDEAVVGHREMQAYYDGLYRKAEAKAAAYAC